MKKLLVATAVIASLPYVAMADEHEPKFTASAELGALYKTGNSRSADIKTGFDVNYETGLWRHEAYFDLLIKKTEQEDDNGDKTLETSDQKWTIDAKTNYTLDTNKRNYLYGNASYEDNRFGSFESQASVSAGWGRRWIDTKEAKFDLDFGPGFKQDITRATDTEPSMTQSAFIIQAQGTYTRQLNEHVKLRQVLTAKVSPKSGENDKYRAETSITTQLIETLQLKFSVIIDHNSVVDEGRKKTDTETAVTLVYNF